MSESAFLLLILPQILTVCGLFLQKWKRMLHLIVFQLSSVGRRFNVVKAMDQNFALWIDFYVKQTK